MKKALAGVLAGMFLLVFCGTTQARGRTANLYVPSKKYPDIFSAIEAAKTIFNKDKYRIHVKPGVYSGGLYGESIKIQGSEFAGKTVELICHPTSKKEVVIWSFDPQTIAVGGVPGQIEVVVKNCTIENYYQPESISDETQFEAALSVLSTFGSTVRLVRNRIISLHTSGVSLQFARETLVENTIIAKRVGVIRSFTHESILKKNQLFGMQAAHVFYQSDSLEGEESDEYYAVNYGILDETRCGGIVTSHKVLFELLDRGETLPECLFKK